MKKLLLLLCFALALSYGHAQGPGCSLPTLTVGPGEIVVPVQVSQFNNIAAVSIYFEYDPAVLDFIEFTDPALTGLEANSFVLNGATLIGISWSTSTNAGVDFTGTLVNIHFTYLSGQTTLAFKPFCQVTTYAFTNLAVLYADGSISPNFQAVVSLPSLSNQNPSSGLSIPLSVDFSQVSGGVSDFTLIIQYSSNLTYSGISNSALVGIVVNQLVNPTRLALQWSTVSGPSSALDGVLANLLFIFSGGSASLVFDQANCVVTDASVQAVGTSYVDGAVSQSDPVVFRAGHVSSNPQSTALIPVTVENFTGIQAFDLSLAFNPGVMSVVDIVNIHPNLPAANLDFNASSGSLLLNWNNASAVTIPFGEKLFDIQVSFLSGNSALTFQEADCSVSNAQLQPLTALFENGSITDLSQTAATVWLPDTLATPLQSIELPMKTSGFTDMGAFDFALAFNSSVLTFNGLTLINPDLDAVGSLSYNCTGNHLLVSWTIDASEALGLTLADGEALFQVQFTYAGGSSSISFQSDYCSMAKNDYTPVNVTWVDGSVGVGIELQVKVYLEGLYNALTGTMNQAQASLGVSQFPGTTVDQIGIELRDQSHYNTLVYSASSIDLHPDGTATITIPGQYSGSYYLTIKHRNHLETVSSTPISFNALGIQTNFTTGASYGTGSQHPFSPTIYALFGGDINQDGLTNALDAGTINAAVMQNESGYHLSDINGDGVVNALDAGKVNTNVIDNRQKSTPTP